MKIWSKYKNIKTMKKQDLEYMKLYIMVVISYYLERENEVLKFNVYNSSYFEINASLF